MWDTVQTNERHLTHDLPCPACGHAVHTYLPCDDGCECCGVSVICNGHYCQSA